MKIIETFITHFILYVFKTVYSFQIINQQDHQSINKNFGNTFTVLTSLNFKNKNKTAIDNATLKLILVIKNNNECEWDPMKLMSYTICTNIFKFL